MSALILSTPCGRPASVSRTFFWSALFSTLRTPLAGAQAIARLGSTVATSAAITACIVATHSAAWAAFALGTQTAASASRGIAFRLLPPSTLATRAPIPCRASSTRVIIFRALPRPVWISRPEWPPFSPLTVTSSPVPPIGASSYSAVHVPVLSRPPEQPTYSSPSSSESRLRSVPLRTKPGCRLLAPVSPVSSSTVKRSSSGP